MNTTDLWKRHELVKGFILETGDWVKSSLDNIKTVYKKDGGADVTTNIDIAVEKKFHEFVKKHFPEDGFFGEELKELRNIKDHTWYVDPIDGTKYLANNIPL